MADLCAANVAERAREAGHAIAGFAWTADARRRVSQEWADDLDARDAEIARLTKELEEARAQGLLDGQDLVNLRQQVEDCIGNAQTDADGDGWITAYHFNTGSIHRLLAMARDIRPHQGRVFRTVGPPALAPPEPKAETPAETPITDLAQAMREALARRGYQPAPPSPSPAQPSQDVAGTSGESLAGLSKEGSETP